ncbi:hypothetical protein [Thalassotalea profundi]|uniref:Peptidase M1 membrane alanine aminopeptidase domain-containing protein n=1 Tax=Thalassotalea profundi TaxID=2036687 RepID=A0ABQ3IBM7_9GAMM|nr:hypothetical protein [Thalassotalea profundi]GHE77420.1 hypothetical protein GCM10011501_01220 [Thalassotalea profundi]
MNKILVILSLLFSVPTFSVELPIKLTGTIDISVINGTIDANFQLDNIPKLKNYLIFLNSGFNIQYFRNQKDTANYPFDKTYNTNYSYESFGYYLPDNTVKGKFLPSTMQFKYTGKFPVINNMNKASESGDWKGNIAFNGKTIRTDGFQTAWYPILYDIELDKRYDEVTYNIEVTCLDCKSIYVNGSKPISASHGIFKRDNPVSLILFAGDYNIGQQNGSYYLNSGLSANQMSELGKITSSYEQYYQEKLSLPYGESVVYIHTTPISKKNSWLFVSYPAIVTINHDEGGLSNLFDESESSWFKPFIAHELAHYYFGTYRDFNSELGDMFSESFAEYLSLKLTKKLINEKVYLETINKKLSNLEDKNFVAIKDIKNKSDYGNRNRYVYTYAPIVWLAIEKEIGEENMWLWINKMLTVETEFTDYKFMIKTLTEVLNNDAKLAFLVENYFANKDAINQAKILLK